MNGEDIKRFLPEVLRTLFIAGVTSGVTMLGTVQAMNTKLAVLEGELRDSKILLAEVRADLKEIQKLAAERGKSIPDLERRIERLENRK